MPNHRLNGRPPFDQLAQLRREIPASRDIDRHRSRVRALPAKALINKRFRGADSRYPLDLSQRWFQGCSILGLVVCGIDSDNPAPPRRRDDAHFAAKLIVLGHFAFSDALHLRSMDTIEFPLIGALLDKDPPGNTHDLGL